METDTSFSFFPGVLWQGQTPSTPQCLIFYSIGSYWWLSSQSVLSVSLERWAIPLMLNLGGVADWALLFGKNTC